MYGFRNTPYKAGGSRLLTLTVFLLTAIGLLSVCSATADNGLKQITVQLFSVLLGVCFAYFSAKLPLLRLGKAYPLLYALGLIALSSVFILSGGRETNGAISWIRFGPISVQPSEPVKLLYCFLLAEQMANAQRQNALNHPLRLFMIFLFAVPFILLVLLQNDTGTALCYGFMLCVMLVAAGLSLRCCLSLSLLITIALPFIWRLLAPFQKSRIAVFLNPSSDPSGAGYQVKTSLQTLSSGRLFGRGFLSGPQNRFHILPEKDTDFIFSIIGEEWGFLGCAIIVLLLFTLIFLCFQIARKTQDASLRLLLSGLGAMFFFHTTENIGMCLGLLPVTGIPLPFISYGGSHLVTCFGAIGLMQNVHKINKTHMFQYQ